MATGADVRDILELSGGDNDAPISKKDFLNSDKVRGRLMVSDAWLSWLSVQQNNGEQVNQGVNKNVSSLYVLYQYLGRDILSTCGYWVHTCVQAYILYIIITSLVLKDHPFCWGCRIIDP